MPEITLQRSWFRRLVCGRFVQPYAATLAVCVLVALVISGARGAGANTGVLAGVLVVLILLLVPGATAHAEADALQISWRHFRRHQVPWSDVSDVVLETRRGLQSVQRYVVVRAGSRQYRISPVEGAGAGRIRFGQELAAAARARGIPATDRWAGVPVSR